MRGIFLAKIIGLNLPPLGGLLLGWGLDPHPDNLAVNCQLFKNVGTP